MIITKTPFRMSFFGGGTDMPEFFSEHGGAVLSTTFDKYCYVNVRHLPRFFHARFSEAAPPPAGTFLPFLRRILRVWGGARIFTA